MLFPPKAVAMRHSIAFVLSPFTTVGDFSTGNAFNSVLDVEQEFTYYDFVRFFDKHCGGYLLPLRQLNKDSNQAGFSFFDSER